MLKTKIVHDFVKFSEGISYQLSNHVKPSRSVPSAPRSESGHLSRRSSSLIVINNRYSSWIIMNDHYMIMIISWWSIINYNSQYVFYEVWFISASFYHWSPRDHHHHHRWPTGPVPNEALETSMVSPSLVIWGGNGKIIPMFMRFMDF